MNNFKSVTAENFEINFDRLLDQVAKLGEPLTITRDGKPVARLLPIEPKRKLFGALKGDGYREGDIISPSQASWDTTD